MTKTEMENLVQRQLEAYNRRDLEGFCACYHREVKIVTLITGQQSCDGMDNFREIYRGLFDSNPNLRCELKSRIVLDAAVIDEEAVTGAARYPDGLHAVAIYGFRDKLIDRIWFPR